MEWVILCETGIIANWLLCEVCDEFILRQAQTEYKITNINRADCSVILFDGIEENKFRFRNERQQEMLKGLKPNIWIDVEDFMKMWGLE